MPLVGVNNEPLQERAIFAYDGSNYRVVKCDGDGNIVAAIDTGQTIEVTQDTAADLKCTASVGTGSFIDALNKGYVSAAWQKDPIRFGYSDALKYTISNSNLAAGASTTDGSLVPTGEFWVITNLSMNTISVTITRVDCRLVIDGTTLTIFNIVPPTTNVLNDRQGWWVLGPGDKASVRVYTATAGDDVYLYATGFKVDIDQ
jgi:hypothetical protein